MLPAAASLKKQGANNGATTAFLISTPESGVDSIALTYALLDPLLTLVRPLAAFVSATLAGIGENLFSYDGNRQRLSPDLTCPVDGCCDGIGCSPAKHRAHHTLGEKIAAGFRFAFGELWNDIATWFFVGLLLAGVITTWVPDGVVGRYLGGGVHSMVAMLLLGVPLYICATASTPIAAALVLKGVSPGAALVFLLVGPATNVTSLTVVLKVLGRRATVIYLGSLVICAIGFGLVLDRAYLFFNLSPQAAMGEAAELIPAWGQWLAAVGLLAVSIRVWFQRWGANAPHAGPAHGPACDCGHGSGDGLTQISDTRRG